MNNSQGARGGNRALSTGCNVLIDSDRLDYVDFRSVWCQAANVEHFFLFKMASKMAEIPKHALNGLKWSCDISF